MLLLVFLSFLSVHQVISQTDYCGITRKHTMCQYKGLGPKCGKALARGLTRDEMKEVLDVHNEFRATIARGEERRGRPGPQPAAGNMRQMTWDNELATVAQRHADQCNFAHDCSDCRKVDRFGVGQNLYIYKQSQRLGTNDWRRAVKDWYEEVELFSNRKVKPFQFSTAIGHYSQLVWAETDKVGCGATSYRDGKWFATLYTCNYGPNGNFIRGEMYKQAPACSACPAGTSCSKQFPGLCSSSGSSSLEPVQPAQAARPAQPAFSVQPSRPLKPFRPVISRPIQPVLPVFEPTTRKPSNPFITTNRFQPPIRTTRRPRPSTTRRTTTTTRKPTTERTTTRRTTTRRPTTRRPTTTRRTTTRTTTTARTTTQRPQPVAKSTTLGPAVVNNQLNNTISTELFSCDFTNEGGICAMRNTGTQWVRREGRNTYYETDVLDEDKTELFFENMVPPPDSGLACLDFRYKKSSGDGDKTPLQVLAWPFRGRPGKINIFRDSPDERTWIRAQVTYRNIDNFFLIMFRATGSSLGRVLHLALDDISITSGRCNAVAV